MADLPIASAATLTGAGTASGDQFPVRDVSAAAGSQGSKITRDELRIAMGLTGGGTVSTAGFTLAIPATGTAALLGTANVFTALQTITPAVNAKALVVTGVTHTADSPIFDLAQTWNNGAVTFTADKINVTNTASAAASLLIDRQVGGVSKFKVAASTGHVTTTGGFFGSGAFDMSSTWGVNASTGNQIMYVTATFGWSATNGGQAATADAFMARRAAAHIGFGAASATPIAQTIGGAQGLGTDITGGVLNIGTRGTGSGTGGVINFQTHAAGASSSTLGTLVNVLSIISPGVIRITSIPTSSAGLSPGDVYSNAGILTIVS